MAESQGGDGKGAIPAKRAMAGVTQDAPVVPPCGACKFLRRKCSGVGVSLHLTLGQTKVRKKKKKVFGASNVSKLLSNISTNHRHEAAATISYEAQARLSDPVYGCVSTILFWC
jgi:hypothetical protein